MHAQLKDLMQVILTRYDGWLYNAPLTELIYLVDVEAVRRIGDQVTDIEWRRDNFGPFVWDVIDCAKLNNALFEVQAEVGNKRKIICKNPQFELPEFVVELVDFVVKSVPDPKASFSTFKDYVYSTPPMILSKGNGPLYIERAMEAARDVDEIIRLTDTPEWEEALEYLAAN